ncbi:MAG TPA: hypothetical protein VNM37_03255 [Candidatus Dormibacteraeota bacterium]|nr:hypothetical protein [Candidatus Dormibacteraeota bacterium]
MTDRHALLQVLVQLAQQQGRLAQRVVGLEKEMALTKTDFDTKLGALVALLTQLQGVVETLVQQHTTALDLTPEGTTVDQLTVQVQTILDAATAALNG